MSEYKKYTDEDIEKAKSVDTLDFLMKKGYYFRQVGNEYKGIEHDSFVINRDRHRWYWNSRSVGGYSVIDFCVKVEGKTFREALDEILDYSRKYANTTSTEYRTHLSYEQNQAEKGPRTIINCPKLLEQQELLLSKLPKAENEKFKRLYAYLCKRGICPELIRDLITTKRIYQDFRGNIVFLGYDRYSKKPQYAAIRSTCDNKFRGDIEGSNKEVSFFIGNYNTKTLYVFESPIDTISFATLLFKEDPQKSWKNVGLLSLGGTSIVALEHFIQTHPNVKKIVAAMDNDDGGLKSSKIIQETYEKSHLIVKFLNFPGKDINETLTKFPLSPLTQSDDLSHVVERISEMNSSVNSHEAQKPYTQNAPKMRR